MHYQHMKGPGDLPYPGDPQDEDSFIAERAAELATLPELIADADSWNDGMQDGEHYTALEVAMADLHSVQPADLLGSAVLERLYALAKVHGEARAKKVKELAEHKAWCEWTDRQTGPEE